MAGQRVSCPECGKVLQVRSGLGPGTKLRCPDCQEVFPVPRDEGDRLRKKQKKSQGGNLGLIIGLSVAGGFLLIALVVVVAVVASQNGPGGVTGAVPPRPDGGARPVGGDGGLKQQPVATGKVAAIPSTILKDLPVETPLTQVETRLGGPGKVLPREQWNPDVTNLANLRGDPNVICYHWWTAEGDNLYLLVLNGNHSGGMFRGRGTNPVGGDPLVKEGPTGVVKGGRIPPNFLGGLKTKYDPNPTTLAEVEVRLGGRGAPVPRGQLPPEVQTILQVSQPGPNEVYYLWSAGGDRLYLFFDNGVYNGGRLLPRELPPNLGGDRTGPGPGPGKVAVVSRDFLNQLRPKGSPQPTTLPEVDQMLGIRGKKLTKVNTEVANVLGQPNQFVACYVWIQGTNRLYLNFENGVLLAGYYKGK